LRKNGSHAPRLDGDHSDLPARREPAVRTALPLLSKLFLLRAHGDRTPWSAARQLARRKTPPSLPSVFGGRLRPCAGQGTYPGQETDQCLIPASCSWSHSRRSCTSITKRGRAIITSLWRAQRPRPPPPHPALPAPPAAIPRGEAAAPDAASPMLHVVTDVLDVSINLKGGEIDRADLTQYPVHKDTPNVPVRLENRDPESLYLIQSGLTGKAGEAAPTHLATWTAAQTSYVLPAGANELRVPMTWTDGQGLTVTKTFVFARAWYAIGLDYEVRNAGAEPRSIASYT